MWRRYFTKDSLSVILPAGLGVLLFVVVLFGLVVPSYKDQLVQAKKDTVQELSRLGWEMLARFHDMETEGVLTRAEAQQQAKVHLRDLQFGRQGKDYFWIMDMSLSVVMHPYRPDLVGLRLNEIDDPDLRDAIKAIVEKARTSGDGFVPYKWQWQDDPSRIMEKVSYICVFKPWNWIIGAGVYTEDVENEVISLTGKLMLLSVLVACIVLAVALVIVDQSLKAIEHRRLAEESLRREQDRTRRYFEVADVIMVALDSKGLVQSVNPKGLQILGYEPDELIGRNWFDICIPDRDREERRSEFEKAIRSGRTTDSHAEASLLTRQGDVRIVRWHMALFLDEEGCPEGTLSSGEDITLKRSMEEELKAGEKRYRTLIQNMNDGLIVFDSSGRVNFANKRFFDIIGRSSDEVIGADFRLFTDQADIDLETLISNSASTGLQEIRWQQTDGRGIVTVASFNKISTEDDSAGFAVITDITPLRRAMDEVFRLAEVVRQASEAVIIINRDRSIEWVNPAFENIFEYTADEVLGLPADFMLTGRAKERTDNWARVEEGYDWTGQAKARKKDGTSCLVETSLTSLKDRSGQVINYLGVVRDVTREKNLEKQLAQSRKMEAIGTLAGGIAHDFNNILSSIIGYTELARRRLDPEGIPYQDLGEVMEASHRAKDLVQQILIFSRQGEQEWRPLKLTPVIKETLKLLRPMIPSTVEIRSSLDAPDDVVVSNPTQIQQVLMNLCSNAAQAMKDKAGVLEVILDSVVLGEAEARQLQNLDSGRYLRIRISDTGHGMEPEILARVFDPFFTTKGRGEGTGMGLAVVHGIVREHNGAVTAESQPQAGSTFTVYLPGGHGEVADELDTTPKAQMMGGSERILVVDDEPALVELWQRTLKSLGYQVTVSESSLSALEQFQEAPDDWDLLITDYTMPGLNGAELAQKVHAIRSNLPIIICTGAPNEAGLEKARTIVQAFLSKPYDIASMTATVRRILDGLKAEE